MYSEERETQQAESRKAYRQEADAYKKLRAKLIPQTEQPGEIPALPGEVTLTSEKADRVAVLLFDR